MSFVPIPCPPASGGGGGNDIEQLLLCDVVSGVDVVGTALAVYDYDASGNPVGPPTFVIPGTNDPYVVQGVLQPCPEGSVVELLLCDVVTGGGSTQFIRKMIQSASGEVLEVIDHTLSGAVYTPLGTVQDCNPYALCTPDSNLDLNADCGPGESPTQSVIANDTTHPLANSVYVDDPLADPLCGGSWDNPAATLGSPFPVDESFRNATFDQPGPVLQGNGPSSAPPTYPFLTADPANTGEGNPATPADAAGAGWLRASDIDSGTNGIWQVPTPFPTAQGTTAAITLASHDGTTPGGDGAAFVFTDGSVAPQSAAIGGFGNLGLQNWEGGYVAVVLDEYGQTCTCNHSVPPIVDPAPGPCGFCTNTISIQLAGAARVGASCACCTIAQMPLAPHAINQTTRSKPLRLITSIISEGGQTYVSASIDWNDGTGPVTYFDRLNVTACAGPPPATLRMASYGGSGGAYRAVKEWRDASARPAGEIHWRAFPIVTDPIPPCVTLVTLNGSVDVTFNSDTQVAGNGDPEAYFWLVNESTGTVVARAQKTSVPSQVGTPTTLKWTFNTAPANLANLMIYVGSESRDQNGEYDTLFENLTIDATGAGCPAEQRRTMEISARCPIPVTIIGGGEDGGGGGTTVVNTPATFEDALVCADGGTPAFRREVRTPDGNIDVQFLSTDGLPLTPGTWQPGPCPDVFVTDQVLCDAGNGSQAFLRKYVQRRNPGTGNPETLVFADFEVDGQTPYTPTGPIQDCAIAGALITPPVADTELTILCDDNGPFVRTYRYDSLGVYVTSGDQTLAGAPYVAVGTVTNCGAVEVFQGEFILCDSNNEQFVRKFIQDAAGTVTDVVDFNLDGTPFVPAGVIRVCPPASIDTEQEILCDDNGPFIRTYIYDQLGGIDVIDRTLAGAVYVTVGTIAQCPVTVAATSEFDIEEEILCDDNGGFIRRFTFNGTTGALVSTGDFTFAGAVYAPVGTVHVCSPTVTIERDVEEEVLCDDNGAFIRRFVFDSATGNLLTTTNLTLAGGAYAPVGTVRDCGLGGREFLEEILCDDNGGFIRRFVFNADTGAVISTTNLTLAGAAYVPVGTVAVCPAPANIDSTVQRQTGAGAVVIASGARSVSVTVIAGTITVNLGQGVMTLPAGSSFTWSVDTIGETLNEAFTFTGVAGSDFVVVSTRKV